MAFISPETDTKLTPLNPGEEPSKNLIRRILRFFSSGKLQLIRKKTEGSQGIPKATLRVERCTISAANGNLSIVHNSYNGCACHDPNSGTSSGSGSSLTIFRPKFMDKLPEIPMWDIHTEERLRDTGFCRVYAARVYGKRALVKEFYGANAVKAWVATARLHAATHLAPEFLRLVGVSGASDETEDKKDVEMRLFLLLELEDIQPWKLGGGTGLKKPNTAEDSICALYLLQDIMDTVFYLMALPLLGFIAAQDVELYQRPVKHHKVSSIRPVLAFNYSEPGRRTSIITSPWALGIHMESMIFNGKAAVEKERSFADKISSTQTIAMRVSQADAEALRAKYDFGEVVYPNAVVRRYTSNNNSATIIFCAFTKSCRPTSEIHLLLELRDRGDITRQEWRKAMEKLDPSADGEITDGEWPESAGESNGGQYEFEEGSMELTARTRTPC